MTPSSRFPLPAGGTEPTRGSPREAGGTSRRGAIVNSARAIGISQGNFHYIERYDILPGDVNRDRCVDDSDLLRVLFAFGQTGSGLPEDLNGDNTVDDADLLTVLFNFGSGCE